MNYITTTQLRTQVPDFVRALLSGETITLIHRSKTLGNITLDQVGGVKIFDAKTYLALTKNLTTRKLSDSQRDKNYREYINNKYGNHLP